MPQLMLGQLVKSIVGRDKGRFMVVIDVIDENYVYIADGDLRKVENPKKKKVKHLKVFNLKVDLIVDKLNNKQKVYNEEIKKALEELVDANLEGKASNRK
ncbi:MAG: RNA-binding protein [Tepidanaerobacteraceae bacterium]|jgi:large subunit ribosomal protein L14e|nr:RNA-binding protein [Thermoanaerobacterales bacterium]